MNASAKKLTTAPLTMILVLSLIGYASLFAMQDTHRLEKPQNLTPALPIPILNVLGHSYMKQIMGEALFIKAAVYLGGLKQPPDEVNLEMMQQHFIAITRLHPRFLDSYYRSESVLAHRGDAYARSANTIMQSGRRVLPDEIVLPFFEGFNYFHYLNEPVKAGKVLRIASEIKGAPPWIGHLASMLMAKGGNIRTGLIWLKGMLATTRDKDEKARYKQDIIAFEKALQVQQAIEHYTHRHGTYPKNLSALLIDDLNTLPTWGDNYVLEYQPPTLFLRRKMHE